MNARTFAAGMIVIHLVLGALGLAHGQCEPRWMPTTSPMGMRAVPMPQIDQAVRSDPDGAGPLDAQIHVIGLFASIGGQPAWRYALWDGKRWKNPIDPAHSDGTFISQLHSSLTGQPLATGEFPDPQTGTISTLARWTNDRWQPIELSLEGGAYSVAESSDGTLLVLWDFRREGQRAQLLRLRGGEHQPIPCQTNGWIQSVAAGPGDDVIVSGPFTQIEGVETTGLARWDGTQWTRLGTFEQPPGNSIRQTIATMPDRSLIVARTVEISSSMAQSEVLRWDGASWTTLLDQHEGYLDLVSVTPDGALYVSGWFSIGGRPTSLARLVAGRWTVIADLLVDGSIFAMAAIDAQRVFAGGLFNMLSQMHCESVGIFEQGHWATLGGGDTYQPWTVFSAHGHGAAAIGIHRGPVGGYQQELARWSSHGWQVLNIVPPPESIVTGDLHGGFIAASRNEWRPSLPLLVSRWNGTEWSLIGSGLYGEPSRLVQLTDETIVMAGRLRLGSHSCAVAQWNGTAWNAMGTLQTASITDIEQMPDGRVVISGSIVIPATGRRVLMAWWDGHEWVGIGDGLLNPDGSIFAMTLLADGSVVAAGRFRSVDPSLRASNVVRWDGSQLLEFGNGLVLEPHEVLTDIVTDIDGLVLLASTIDQPGDQIPGLRKWSGSAWEFLGNFGSTVPGPMCGTNYVESICVDPRGDVLITGLLCGEPSIGFNFDLCYSRSPLPRIATSPHDTTALAGHRIELIAAPILNVDEVSYQWYRNAVPVTSGPAGAAEFGGVVTNARGSLEGRTDGSRITLTIDGATPSDSGSYHVVFTTPCGETASQPARLVIRCFGDFNQDGGIDGSDVDAFFAAWEEEAIEADVDLDRAVDAMDVTDFFVRWSSGTC